MADRKRKWRLVDLVDFEARLLEAGGRDSAELRRHYRAEVGGLKSWPRQEAAKRRVGLRIWLEAGRSEGEEGPGPRVVGGVRVAGIILGIVAFVTGVGVMPGLLQTHQLDLFTRAYNVWMFLALTLGVQWLLLLGGLLGYAVVRRQNGTLSIVQRGVSWLALKLSGIGERSLGKRLLEGGAGYRSVFSWRLARLTQGVAIVFNLGLIAGFCGCLLFLSIGFYWESTFEGSGWGLLHWIHGMAVPWAWSGLAVPPGTGEIGYSVIERVWYEKAGSSALWPFLMMSLVVYGLLPRLALWLLCVWKERRALATLSFQAPRHRELWRRLTKVERTLASEGQADGVVLIDVGGIGLPTDAVRGFLLRELRVNPQERFTAAVFDGEGEEQALEAIRKADLGVVFLVEGWALSPKQMGVLHERVRSVGGADIPVNFLVLGELRNGSPSAPAEAEWTEWKRFVDSLRDPAAEAVAFAELAEVGGDE